MLLLYSESIHKQDLQPKSNDIFLEESSKDSFIPRVQLFQRLHNLSADGILGPETRQSYCNVTKTKNAHSQSINVKASFHTQCGTKIRR